MTKKTNLLITIDTETFSNISIETNIYGLVNDRKYGIELVMDRCDELGYKATFFVDVTESYVLGAEKMAAVCRLISGRGHDVQLHIHPNYFPGCEKGLMSDYSLTKQGEMISAGKSMIREWTGADPVAFRAGAYGADTNTIKALQDNGFKVDSSYFAFQENCRLSGELNNQYKNIVFKIGEIWEIPVTIYSLPGGKHSKIDINACSLAEINFALDALAGKVDTIVLFLHSFSFIKKGTPPIPDEKNIGKFAAVLKFISSRADIAVKSVKQYYREELTGAAEPGQSDLVPELGYKMLIKRLSAR